MACERPSFILNLCFSFLSSVSTSGEPPGTFTTEDKLDPSAVNELSVNGFYFSPFLEISFGRFVSDASGLQFEFPIARLQEVLQSLVFSLKLNSACKRADNVIVPRGSCPRLQCSDDKTPDVTFCNDFSLKHWPSGRGALGSFLFHVLFDLQWMVKLGSHVFCLSYVSISLSLSYETEDEMDLPLFQDFCVMTSGSLLKPWCLVSSLFSYWVFSEPGLGLFSKWFSRGQTPRLFLYWVFCGLDTGLLIFWLISRLGARLFSEWHSRGLAPSQFSSRLFNRLGTGLFSK